MLNTEVSDAICFQLTTCNSATEWIQTHHTTTSDRRCDDLRICNLILEYQTVAPDVDVNRECTNLTQCTNTQYDIIKATPTSDRECIEVELVSLFTEFVEFSTPPTASTVGPINTTVAPEPDRRRRDAAAVQLYEALVGEYLEAVAAEAGTFFASLGS